ncbi:MAG: bifunctional ornithine acetyltransferase/N-acetylglutamate synthase [SAR86 cluster bacterium]|uniref:Arginine biosynthesis bifunctional protein ArgJ n=1 Tax=SAR86 cluster bacterium TaxID=2030880 RepID=A0A2A4XHC0_9GAMM|nr:MAG: bifunctional ornithine acetyltransferase/N-acetylglutamate synthase [SAR86 cluster bacterium]
MAVGSERKVNITPIEGIRLAAVESQIRYANRLDLVLVEIAPDSTTAGVFTQNAFCAAPVRIARQRVEQCASRYFLINTGNANAGTGPEGELAAMACCDGLAEIARTSSQQILPFSTGVIGESLPFDKILAALPALYETLSADAWESAAQGILTTDTRPKLASASFTANGSQASISGFAKGSGMIRPNMATLLAYVFTDAQIEKPLLEKILDRAVKNSFNRITVDGDTSTNDCCMLVATGKGSLVITDSDSEAATQFQSELNAVFEQLATDLIRDAEGASKFITIEVSEGASEQECLAVAYTVAESPLVKTAFFASDPNWGRILAAIGRAGLSDLDIESVTVALGDTLLVSKGSVDAAYSESAGQAEMDKDEIRVRINLGRGKVSERVWTSDLSSEYVRINADYRS